LTPRCCCGRCSMPPEPTSTHLAVSNRRLGPPNPRRPITPYYRVSGRGPSRPAAGREPRPSVGRGPTGAKAGETRWKPGIFRRQVIAIMECDRAWRSGGALEPGPERDRIDPPAISNQFHAISTRFVRGTARPPGGLGSSAAPGLFPGQQSQEKIRLSARCRTWAALEEHRRGAAAVNSFGVI